MSRETRDKALRVVHIVDSLSPRMGGPPAVVVQLATHQLRQGAQVAILTHGDPELGSWWRDWCNRSPGCSGIDLSILSRRSSLAAHLRSLQAAATTNDVLHIHGVWGKLTWSAMQARRTNGAVTVVAPHGALAPWSLRHKRLKKRLALALIWRRSLERVDLLHALNGIEREGLAQELPGVPVEVLPNGVSPEEFAARPWNSESLLDPLTGGRPFLLFLARLHYVKGPDRLLEAFALASTSSELRDTDLVIAGADFGMLDELRNQARSLGLTSRIRFVGEVGGDLKVALLHQALCLCQPSRHETFSIALLESLACGLPVVITPESNFPEIGHHRAGLIAEGSARGLSEALVSIAASRETRAAMGAAGRELVRREFTWTAVARRSLRAYERLRYGAAHAAAQRASA